MSSKGYSTLCYDESSMYVLCWELQETLITISVFKHDISSLQLLHQHNI